MLKEPSDGTSVSGSVGSRCGFAARESEGAQTPTQRVHFGLNVDLQLCERANVCAGGEHRCGGLREREKEQRSREKRESEERERRESERHIGREKPSGFGEVNGVICEK